MKTIITTSMSAFWIFVTGVAVCSHGCSLSEGADKARKEEPQSLSLTDVSTHATVDNCWIVIDDGVYNVTDYIKNHPAPPGLITPYCGKDATEAYRTKGGRGRPHSPAADEELKEFRVGTLSR